MVKLKPITKIYKLLWEVFFIFICLGTMILLLLGGILRESPTFDEVVHTEAGYQFLVNKDFSFDPQNLPLAREIIALPTLISRNVILDRSIFWPRMMVVLFTVGLAIIVYLFSRRMYGGLAAKLALLLFIFEPNILANGHYATTDLIFTFFLILSLFLFWVYRRKFTIRKVLIFSIIVGLTLSTKITSIPFLILPMFFIFITEKNKKYSKFIILFIFITAMTLWSTYFFKFAPPLGSSFDKNRPAIALARNNPLINILLKVPVPLGNYMSTIKQTVLINYTNLRIQRSFIMGKVLYGSPGYLFFIVFLIKTPLPLLFLLLLSLFVFYKNVKHDLYILIPLFFIFFSILFTKVMLVNRYILPVYPLIVIYSSQIINIKNVNRILLYLFLAIMVAWYALGTINVFPHFISYMNETVGGWRNGYKYLIDSNYDWGQGLIDLKEYQDKYKISNFKLAYFGTANPKKYGIQFKNIVDENSATLMFNKSDIVAISASCWYFCGYYKNPNLNKMVPDDIIGGSILIFKIH